MTHAEAWERFERWFRTDGHWVYRSRQHAIDTWSTRGIDGLPDFPQAEIRESFGELIDYWRRTYSDARKSATRMVAVAIRQYPWLADQTPREVLDAANAWLALTPREIVEGKQIA